MAKKGLKRGVFITFEGVEGCGKSTHAKLLYGYLERNMKLPCLYTVEPAGTKTGDKIRRILLNPKNTSLSSITELFLFEASRSQLVKEVIRPALKKKSIVICDRFYDATTAYQGCAGALGVSLTKRISHLATGGLKPDLTIILDIDTRKGLRRAARRRGKDRMEKKDLSYHNRVRRGYIEIAKREPRRVKLIQTKKAISETQELIRREVLNVVQRYKTAG